MALSQNTSATHKTITTSSPSFTSPSSANDTIHVFDCAICYESLKKPGPPLSSFTFGKLLINVCQLPYLEREHIYREFQLVDQCFSDGHFDCNKIMSTICGHMFHSGCIREWFFTKRLDNTPKCPFCNRRTCYEECRIVHPIACGLSENEEDVHAATLNETEYSDISCTTSSWPSEDESNESDDEDDETEPIINGIDDLPVDIAGSEDRIGMPENLEETIPPVLEEEPIYYPVFVGQSNDEMDNSSTKQKQFLQAFVLVHLLTLLSLVNCACKLFQWKKKVFLEEMDCSMESMADEQLLETDLFQLVPLGYEFIALLFIFGGLIVFVEEAYLAIFARKK